MRALGMFAVMLCACKGEPTSEHVDAPQPVDAIPVDAWISVSCVNWQSAPSNPTRCDPICQDRLTLGTSPPSTCVYQRSGNNSYWCNPSDMNKPDGQPGAGCCVIDKMTNYVLFHPCL